MGQDAEELARLRRVLRGRYPEVARKADVTWNMVWQVLHGRKTSRNVMDVARELAGPEKGGSA